MPSSFSRTLSLLRQEANLSQRVASADLKVSQALLSHYENGVREPGLEFVIRACDYYQVSADYLLGRTMSRDGTAINPEELHDISDDKDNVMRGSVLAVLNKKLLVNTIGIIMDILGKTGHKASITHASNYISTSLYRVFRHMYSARGKNPEAFFSVPSSSFQNLADADMRISEARFVASLVGRNLDQSHLDSVPDFGELSNDMLEEEYPQLVKSILMVLHSSGERLKGML